MPTEIHEGSWDIINVSEFLIFFSGEAQLLEAAFEPTLVSQRPRARVPRNQYSTQNHNVDLQTSTLRTAGGPVVGTKSVRRSTNVVRNPRAGKCRYSRRLPAFF